jgi:hypothetical protein
MKLNRQEYSEAIEKVGQVASSGVSYLDQFEFDFPDGLNTASVLEICRISTDTSLESKIKLAKICIAGKTVKGKCPNGEEFSFCLSSVDDGFDGFDVFKKDPLILMALADTIYGYVLKKSLRFSEAQTKPQVTLVRA